MGQVNSSNICGGSTQSEQERIQTETYLPSNYYPYHINHLQNSEYHPRTFNKTFKQDKDQIEYNQQISFQSSQTNPTFNPINQEQSHSFQQNNSNNHLKQTNIKQEYTSQTNRNQERTRNQIDYSNAKEMLSPFNYTQQTYQTYTSPFQTATNTKFSSPSQIQSTTQTSSLGDQEKLNQQQKSYAERIQKLAELVSFSPVLRLTVLASANLKKDQILTINAQGLLSGFRNDRDGYVFFGCKKKPKRMNKFIKQTQIINDFIIPPTDPQQAKQQRGRQFQIRYDIQNNFYTIVDLGVGFGAFKKLTTPHVLLNHDLISFGLTLCTIKFTSKENPNKSFSQKTFQNKEDIILKAQFFGGYSNGEIYELDSKEFQEVSIGRSINCSLSFKDKLISKVQCLLSFNQNHGWVLKDGDGNLPSTNGTWIYLQKEEQIFDGMVIKSNQTVFQASIH